MKMIQTSIMVLALAVLTACSGTSAQLGSTNTGSTADIDFSKGRPIAAEACGFQLLLLIPISTNNRMERTNYELAAAAHGDYITDVKITESWTYGFVGTV